MRGEGRARTPNQVRRSSVPSRRPHLTGASMLACMLVLNATRTTSLILGQRTYSAANAMTLLVPRLLRGARCSHGRRGLCRLVLGLGSAVGTLIDTHSSASVHSTTRLLRRRWKRRRRNSCLRILLLRWHVDEDDEDLACVHAGSGSHNLDAPYLARQRCRGKLIHEHLWGSVDRAPFDSVREEVEQRADQGGTREQFYPASGRTDA